LAIGDILFGHANPSAKLPVSFAHRLEDNPSHPFYPGPHGKSLYQEDIFVGYRGLAMRSTPVLGCFGHGLSYTTFNVSNARNGVQNVEVDRKSVSIEVEVDVQNTGNDRPGAEVVQVYVKPPSTTAVPRPARELADFQKVHLAPGESKAAKFKLERDALSYWFSVSETEGHWKVDAGKYEIEFGTSSEDIKQVLVVNIETGFEWQGL
jgi:beta-glucosidase